MPLQIRLWRHAGLLHGWLLEVHVITDSTSYTLDEGCVSIRKWPLLQLGQAECSVTEHAGCGPNPDSKLHSGIGKRRQKAPPVLLNRVWRLIQAGMRAYLCCHCSASPLLHPGKVVTHLHVRGDPRVSASPAAPQGMTQPHQSHAAPAGLHQEHRVTVTVRVTQAQTSRCQ